MYELNISFGLFCQQHRGFEYRLGHLSIGLVDSNGTELKLCQKSDIDEKMTRPLFYYFIADDFYLSYVRH